MRRLWCEERKWLAQVTQLFLGTKQAVEPGFQAQIFCALVRNPSSYKQRVFEYNMEGGALMGGRDFVLWVHVETGLQGRVSRMQSQQMCHLHCWCKVLNYSGPARRLCEEKAARELEFGCRSLSLLWGLVKGDVPWIDYSKRVLVPVP